MVTYGIILVLQVGASAGQASTRPMGSHRFRYGTGSLNALNLLYCHSMPSYVLSTTSKMGGSHGYVIRRVLNPRCSPSCEWRPTIQAYGEESTRVRLCQAGRTSRCHWRTRYCENILLGVHEDDHGDRGLLHTNHLGAPLLAFGHLLRVVSRKRWIVTPKPPFCTLGKVV